MLATEIAARVRRVCLAEHGHRVRIEAFVVSKMAWSELWRACCDAMLSDEYRKRRDNPPASPEGAFLFGIPIELNDSKGYVIEVRVGEAFKEYR